jgi:hypothetical protein
MPTILPDGSAFDVISLPLPDDHWIYKSEPPPMPFRMGTSDARRRQFNEMVRAAARYAVSASMMRGQASVNFLFDPDAIVQNFVVGMFGYHTPDGLSTDGEDNPNPAPYLYPLPL